MIRPLVLFDMDGTLVDSTYFWNRAPQEVMYARGILLTDEDELSMEKAGFYGLADYLIGRYGLPITPQEFMMEQDAVMLEHYRRDVLIRPNALAYLKRLRGKGIRTAVLTASDTPFIERMIDKFSMQGLFDRTYSSRALGIEKSNPKIYDGIFRDFACEGKDCTLFEDSAYAVQTAAARGIRGVGILDPLRPQQHEALRSCCVRTVCRYGELLENDIF